MRIGDDDMVTMAERGGSQTGIVLGGDVVGPVGGPAAEDGVLLGDPVVDAPGQVVNIDGVVLSLTFLENSGSRINLSRNCESSRAPSRSPSPTRFTRSKAAITVCTGSTRLVAASCARDEKAYASTATTETMVFIPRILLMIFLGSTTF